MIVVKKLVVGPVETNCYLIGNQETRETLIFDPGADAEAIKEMLREEKLKPVAILLTHGHFDHLGAVKNLVTEFHLPVYANEAERELLSDLHQILPSPFYEQEKKRDLYLAEVSNFVADGELLELAGMYVTCIATPGHTAGGMSYYFPLEHLVICGDTLFLENIGRTDFPTGSEETLLASIREKLFELPKETVCMPGHGPATNIEYEMKYNMFARIRKNS